MAEGRKYKKKAIPYWLKKKIVKRDNYACQICGKVGEKYRGSAIEYVGFTDYDGTKPKAVRFEPDHIIPERFGGKTEENNLRLTCRKCNRSRED